VSSGSAQEPVELLASSSRLAVVGASGTPGKAAHEIPAELLRRGWDVVPVNPRRAEVLGRRAYADLRDVPGAVDLVVVFRPSEQVEPVARAAVEVGAGALWLQSGIRSQAARTLASGAGMGYVEDECTGALARRHDVRAPAPGSGEASGH
jgi:hypothetical protein